MDNTKTGRFISNLRKEKNLSQKELAEAIGVTDKAVSKWETGRGAPEISLLLPLSRELDISVAELLNGERVPCEAVVEESNHKIVEVLKKNKQKLILSIAAVTFIIAVLLSIYPSYHFFTSVRAGDTVAIEKACEKYFGESSLSVVDRKSKADYTAVLLKGKDHSIAALLKRDDVFSDRVRVTGGMQAGENDIGSYCIGEETSNIMIMAGCDILESEYSFTYMDTKFVCKVNTDKNIVFDLFVESTDSFSNPYDIKLNRNKRIEDFVGEFFAYYKAFQYKEMKAMCTDEYAKELFGSDGKPKGFKSAELANATLYEFDKEKGIYVVGLKYIPKDSAPNEFVILDAVIKETNGELLIADITSDISDWKLDSVQIIK